MLAIAQAGEEAGEKASNVLATLRAHRVGQLLADGERRLGDLGVAVDKTLGEGQREIADVGANELGLVEDSCGDISEELMLELCKLSSLPC